MFTKEYLLKPKLYFLLLVPEFFFFKDIYAKEF